MQGSFKLSFDVISEYYQKKYEKIYPEMSLDCRCYSKEKLHQDSWGFVDKYYELGLSIYRSKNVRALKQSLPLSDVLFLEHREIENEIRNVLNRQLDEEGNNLMVSYIEVGQESVKITLREKENEKVLKKDVN